jgi:beta-glucosidase
VQASVEREVKALKGFARLQLEPGEAKTAVFTIDKRHLSFYDENQRQWIAEPGEFEILIGSSSRDIRLTGKFRLK